MIRIRGQSLSTDEIGARVPGDALTLVTWGKPLLTLDGPENAGLLALGAKPIQPQN